MKVCVVDRFRGSGEVWKGGLVKFVVWSAFGALVKCRGAVW